MTMQQEYFRLADESMCLATVDSRLKNVLPVLTAEVVGGDGLTSERDLVSIVVRRTRPVLEDIQVWADRATGTLFSQTTGECLSSSRVRLGSIPRPKAATKSAALRKKGRGQMFTVVAKNAMRRGAA